MGVVFEGFDEIYKYCCNGTLFINNSLENQNSAKFWSDVDGILKIERLI